MYRGVLCGTVPAMLTHHTPKLAGALLAALVLAAPAPAAYEGDDVGFNDDALVIGAGNDARCLHSAPNPFLPDIEEHCGITDDPTALHTWSSGPHSGFVVKNHAWPWAGKQANGFAITGDSDEGTGVHGLSHSGGGAGVLARNNSTGPGLNASSEFGSAILANGASNSTTALAHNWGNSWGNGGDAFRGYSKQQDGVEGDSSAVNGNGVFGFNDGGGHGVFGRSTKGTKAAIAAHHDSTGDGVRGYSRQADGVEGDSSAPGASGVFGFNDGGGNGVAGRATGAGRGVLAQADAAGTALAVDGKATFSRSGVLTVSSGAAVTKTSIALTAASTVLATLQTNQAGLTIQSAVPNPAGSAFTIHLNRAVSAPVRIAYFVLG